MPNIANRPVLSLPQYWDIASLDIYEGYTQEKYDAMVRVAAGKPIAIGECDKIPSTTQFESDYKWTFFMSWSELTFTSNSDSEIQSLYNSRSTLALDEMPGW